MRTKSISIILLISALIVSSSYSQQKTEWKGKIEYENGVKVIKNPKKPIYSEEVIDLEEELSIGDAEGQAEYIFGQIAAIAVDEKGHIYVADDKDIQIKVFNERGVFLRTIGRAGQGPGEIGRPYDVFINSHEEVVVPDGKNYKLHFYSLEGKFLREKSFGSRFPQQTALGPQDQLYVLGLGRDLSQGMLFELVKLDNDLGVSAILYRLNVPRGEMNESIDEKVPNFCIQSDGNLVMGFAKQDEYRLELISPQGRTSGIIFRDFNPIPIPKEVLEKAKESLPPGTEIKMPTYFAAFYRLVADDEGRIYALTRPVSQDGKSYLWDVFDIEGRYLAEIKLPGSQWHLSNMKKGILWKNGKLYTAEEDENGYHIVKRYEVTWNY